MSNYDALALYLVADGEASLSNPDADWDGVNSVLVAATSGDAKLMATATEVRAQLAARPHQVDIVIPGNSGAPHLMVYLDVIDEVVEQALRHRWPGVEFRFAWVDTQDLP